MKLPLLLPLLAITAARDLNRERREVACIMSFFLLTVPKLVSMYLVTPISGAGNSPLWQRGSCSDLSLPRLPQPRRLHRGLRGEGAREEAKQQLRCPLLQPGACLQAGPLIPRTCTCTCLPRPSSNLPCDALLPRACTRTCLPCSCTILQCSCSCGCPPRT